MHKTTHKINKNKIFMYFFWSDLVCGSYLDGGNVCVWRTLTGVDCGGDDYKYACSISSISKAVKR